MYMVYLGELYKTLYQIFMTRSEIKEITGRLTSVGDGVVLVVSLITREYTVEDPNEEFSDMRDKNDFRHLLNDKAFDGLKAPVPKKIIKELRKKYKLTEVGDCNKSRWFHDSRDILIATNPEVY